MYSIGRSLTHTYIPEKHLDSNSQIIIYIPTPAGSLINKMTQHNDQINFSLLSEKFNAHDIILFQTTKQNRMRREVHLSTRLK